MIGKKYKIIIATQISKFLYNYLFIYFGISVCGNIIWMESIFIL